MSIILYAIPVFFLLIAIELILEKAKQTNYYRLNDAINSLSIGVLSRVTGIVKQLIPFTIYIAVFDHIAVVDLSSFSSIQQEMLTSEYLLVFGVWLFAFIAYDFLYYWNHRLGHEVSLLWAAHVVHHSSEEYNLTTALRQTSGSFLSWIFYLPLAVLGVPPMIFIAVASLNLVYQFWVHTRHVPKLGWYELIFVTPSNHRVHHAQNEIYLDRNYGGVFILWDRLFGTFQEELDDVKPVYGVRKALESWDPIKANWQVYAQLVRDSWHTKRWVDKFKVWFSRTGWRPADVAEKYPITMTNLNDYKKFDTVLSKDTKLYCLIQYALIVVIALVLMLNATQFEFSLLVALAVFVTFSLFSLGMLLENRPFAILMEGIKNLVVIGLSLWLVEVMWLNVTLSIGSLTCLFILLFSYLTSVRNTPKEDNCDESQVC